MKNVFLRSLILLGTALALPLSAQNVWLKGNLGWALGPVLEVRPGPYTAGDNALVINAGDFNRAAWLGLSFERPSGRVWDFALRAGARSNAKARINIDSSESFIDLLERIHVGSFDRQLFEFQAEHSWPLRDWIDGRLSRPYLAAFASAYYAHAAFEPLPAYSNFYAQDITHTGMYVGLVPRMLVRASKTSTRLMFDFSAQVGLFSLRYEEEYADFPGLPENQKQFNTLDVGFVRNIALRVGLMVRLNGDK